MSERPRGGRDARAGATRAGEPRSVRLRGVCAALLVACGHAPPVEEPPPADPVSEVDGDELFARGVGLARTGDLVRAEQYVAAAITQGYPEERALPVLLDICVAASRFRVALGYAEPYLTRNPGDWSLRLLVASIHLAMEDAATARQELERVILAAPDEPEPHYLLGIVMRDEVGDPTSAEHHFRRYLALAPEGPRAREVGDALTRIRVPVSRSSAAEAPESGTPEVSP